MKKKFMNSDERKNWNPPMNEQAQIDKASSGISDFCLPYLLEKKCSSGIQSCDHGKLCFLCFTLIPCEL